MARCGYQLPFSFRNSRLYSQLVAASSAHTLPLSWQASLQLSPGFISLHSLLSVINQFVKRNAQRCGKSIPINIKQTLNCLSALTNRATRQHKYHMTDQARKEEAFVVVVACRLLLLVSISRQHIYHLLRTKCFPQTCKRCQRSDTEAQKNSCCLGSRSPLSLCLSLAHCSYLPPCLSSLDSCLCLCV